jgi:hypothetical protein
MTTLGQRNKYMTAERKRRRGLRIVALMSTIFVAGCTPLPQWRLEQDIRRIENNGDTNLIRQVSTTEALK